ncbi:MAG TPA: hypothetical protein VMF53_08295 [Alphaproteobacteria bacterium]|nr:hypothetical protein [Alphaproteobacteria bacterium]
MAATECNLSLRRLDRPMGDVMACKGRCEKQIYDFRRTKNTASTIGKGGPAKLTEKELDEDFQKAVDAAKANKKFKFQDAQLTECDEGCDCVPLKGDRDPAKDEATDWIEYGIPAKPPLDTIVVPATGNPYTVSFRGKFEVRARIEKRVCMPKVDDD